MFFYATDGYVVYPQFIDETDHIVSKTYMTRVEGENTRLSIIYHAYIEKLFVTLSLS
jgi:IS1 family transposase